jgi:hypothetical protein
MRKLTLDEKISLKGVFAFKGLTVPKLDMEKATFLWGFVCGYNILKWYKYKGCR